MFASTQIGFLSSLRLFLLLCAAASCVFCQEGTDPSGQWMALGEEYAPKQDHGYSWGADGTIDITSDFGLLLGIGPTYTRYAYRSDPYLFRASLVGAIAIPSWRYKLISTFYMPAAGNRLAFEIKANLSTAEVINFYGLGSDTPRDLELEETGYYDVDAMFYGALLYAAHGVTPSLWVGPALALNFMDMYSMEGRLINTVDPTLVGTDRLYVGPGLQLYSDTRERSLYPRSGTFVFAGAHDWFAASPGRRPFYQLMADVRCYGMVSQIPDLVLALRLNGMATFGDVPFYQTARLGGRKSLRGYEFERYRGDHMVSGSLEARFPLLRELIIIPIEFGGFLMADGGRLWYEQERRGGWRGSWGLGIWGATLSRDVLGIVYLAFCQESMIVRAGFGFDF
jgi:hypothetical protein